MGKNRKWFWISGLYDYKQGYFINFCAGYWPKYCTWEIFPFKAGKGISYLYTSCFFGYVLITSHLASTASPVPSKTGKRTCLAKARIPFSCTFPGSQNACRKKTVTTNPTVLPINLARKRKWYIAYDISSTLHEFCMRTHSVKCDNTVVGYSGKIAQFRKQSGLGSLANKTTMSPLL